MEELLTKPQKHATLFVDRLPTKPFCSDELSNGLLIRNKVGALKKRHIQFNSPALVSWLCFDIDDKNGSSIWYDKDLPVPSLIVQNSSNGHAHYLYALKTPVCRTQAGRVAPLRYLAAIESGMTEKLGADVGYSGLICKTPNHTAWRTFEPSYQAIYELSDLAEFVTFPKKSKRFSSNSGLGRNVNLFDRLRFWAYSWVAEYKAKNDQTRWIEAVLAQCEKYNDFPQALPLSEIKAISKSVAKWTWTKYTGRMSDKDFSALQSNRRRKVKNIQIQEELNASTASN
jgi:hypothetical protein